MSTGLGLPAAVPGTPGAMVGEWAAEAERLGFASVSVIDRLVYDNLDPLVALGAAARTERIELMTTVLNVNYRRNAVVLAKQLASVDHLSGGRLTAALGMGGWPQDDDASDLPMAGRGAAFDAMLDTMRRVWDGEIVPDHLDHGFDEFLGNPNMTATVTPSTTPTGAIPVPQPGAQGRPDP
jgi:alkanesulfonate monooxygenase SsuD/methylene tetrahydromethanopterin reductase-like flavin-dependent oxidoreductase (luciferase family)